jgi:hypothetical protein
MMLSLMNLGGLARDEDRSEAERYSRSGAQVESL